MWKIVHYNQYILTVCSVKYFICEFIDDFSFMCYCLLLLYMIFCSETMNHHILSFHIVKISKYANFTNILQTNVNQYDIHARNTNINDQT